VLLRAFIVLVPIAAAVAATILLRSVIPRPSGLGESVAWWVGLVVVSGGVAFGVDHLSRRLTPLVTLLKLSMLFPDRAPSRFAVARQVGSVKRLSDRLAQLEADPTAAEEAESASTILALATALQSHDRRTRGHAERVRVFTDLLAQELKLSKEDRYKLRWAALLHDIGKLKVSSDILNKPGKLDDREWEAIKRHPADGARIASPLVQWLGPWARAITDHHERYDGRGYPNGLAGGSISLGGRIVSVADAYDTMTAARSYKRPMSVRAAREELAKCAGQQFDPAVVRAFFAISLPRLVWRTGPLSYLAQSPFLSPVQEVGRQIAAMTGQGVAAATVAIGVTAATVATPTPAVATAPLPHRPPAAVRPVAGSPSVAPTVGRDPSPGPSGRKSRRGQRNRRNGDGGHGGTSGGHPSPAPPGSGGGSGGSGGSGSGSGSGGSGSGGSGSGGSGSGGSPPPPSPSPAPSPSPSPSPSGQPGPLPSVSLPPLPTPSLPLPSVSLSVGLGG